MCLDNDPGYVHCVLQKRCPRPQLTNPIEEAEELWFKVTPSFAIRFGHWEFCLVTGFWFGPKTHMVDYISLALRNKTLGFRDRVFPSSRKPICIGDVASLFANINTFSGPSKLSDKDCVCLCIILLMEWGFMGK